MMVDMFKVQTGIKPVILTLLNGALWSRKTIFEVL